MKKKLYGITIIITLSLISIYCGESKKESEKTEEISFGKHKVEVYYFHGNRRCLACNNIEKVAKETLTENFADNKDVKFFAINYEEGINKGIAEKYGISWSSLIIASKENIVDLTIEAFQYSTSNPEKIKTEIIDVINDFL